MFKALWVASLAALAATAWAEEPPPVPSTNPLAVVQQRVATTDIEVTYHRPRVRGRSIFGALVPWDQVWRTGADNATTVRFSTAASVGGKPVEAGEYEPFTIPGRENWTVILQPAAAQWGSYGYDPERDVVRVTVPSASSPEPVESFTIAFDDVGPKSAALSIAWANTRVQVPIEIDVRRTVVPGLEAALAADGPRPYFHAAMFYFDNDLDLGRAEELMRQALVARPEHVGMLYRLALILEKQGKFEAAREVAQRSLAAAEAQVGELRDEYRRLNEALLSRLPAAEPTS